MSRSDYRRPADYQVNIIYRCDTCRREIGLISVYGVGPCSCGGTFQECGESYPANSNDWDEERDTQDGEWHRNRPHKGQLNHE